MDGIGKAVTTTLMVVASLQRLLHRATNNTFDTAINALSSVATGEEVKVLRDIEDEKKNLETQLESIRSLLTAAEQKGLHHLCDKWLQQVQVAVGDAEDALDEYATDAAIFRRRVEENSGNLDSFKSEVCKYFSEKLQAYQFDKIRGRLADLVSSVDIVMRQNLLSLQVGVTTSQPRNTPRDPTGGFLSYQDKLVPRDDALKKILDWVEPVPEDTLSILCVHGMGGIGKTTLAQLVYNNNEVERSYLRMWVCVSDDFSVERVTKQIIESYLASEGRGNTCPYTALDALQQTLAKKVGGRRFLLVLDDVWEEDESRWKKLLGPLGMQKSGSRVLVTTRSEKIAKMVMRGQNYEPLRLGRLSDEGILSIIESNVSPKTNRGKFEEFCKKIVKKLGGSPLAAKTLARLINKVRVEHVVNDSPLTSELWKLEENPTDILPILKISYDHLTPSSRECFAYCSLFPKDYIFHKPRLVHFWMAQGFICPQDQTVPLERWGEIHFEELLSSSLLEVYKGDYEYELEEEKEARYEYVMHDLVHDLATSVSQNNCAIMSRKPAEDIPEMVRHLLWIRPSDSLESMPDVLSKCEKLRTLLLWDNYSYWGASWEGVLENIVSGKLRRLRVLSLSRCPVRSLNTSIISDLKHLRCLDFCFSAIEELPESVCDLYNLQVLDLSKCSRIKKLPETFGRLMNLRCLLLSHCPRDKVPESLCKLCNLRELDLEHCSELENLPERLGDLTNLRSLNLRSTKIQVLPESLCNLRHLEVLNIEGCRLSRLPRDVDRLVNLRHLTLSREELYFSITSPGRMTSLQKLCTSAPLTELKHMNELRILKLHRLGDKTEEQAYEAELHSKTQLTALELRFDNETEEDDPHSRTFHDEAVFEGLRPYSLSLKTLTILGYRGVRSPGWMGSLPCLRVLQFDQCFKLRVLPPLPPTLETLEISNCPELMSPGWMGSLPCLRVLQFDQCSKLRVLPPLPPTLETLKISLCPELMWPSSSSLSINPLSEEQQRSLLLSSSLLELEVELSSDTDGDTGFSQLLVYLNDLTSLRKLTILASPSCRGGRSNAKATVTKLLLTPPGEEVLKPLTSLNTLSIRHCPGLAPFKEIKAVISFVEPPFVQPRTMGEHQPKANKIKMGKDNSTCTIPSDPITHSSSLPSSSSTSYPQSSQRFPTKLEELEFFRTPPQLIIGLLREMVLSSLPLTLRIVNCPELSFFGGDGEDEGGSIRPELEEALLELAPTLSRLDFYCCLSLQNLPSRLNDLSSLKSLLINGCPEIKALPDLPHELQELEIRDSIKLFRRYNKETGEDWPQISHIPKLYVRHSDTCLTKYGANIFA